MTEIFKPKTPFLTAPVMDILFNGIGIDCSSEMFEAKSFCSAMENEKAINVVNDTYLTFSILASVSCTFTSMSNDDNVMKNRSNIDVGRQTAHRWGDSR